MNNSKLEINKITTLKKIFLLATCFIGAFSINANAGGGVSLGATRVIYSQNDKQSTIKLVNSDTKNRYLIQSWVENSEGKKTSDFIITPPLFVMSKKAENSIRLVNLNDSLPKDRESVYWLNVKAIPEVDKNAVENKNVLQLAILSKIKIFVRPSGLDMNSSEAPSKISFKQNGQQLAIDNPTPFFVNMVNITVGGKSIDPVMVAPKKTTTVKLPNGVSGGVQFSAVNDFGGITPAVYKIN